MRRLLLNDAIPDDASAHALDEEASHYATNVLRLRSSSRVEALAADGRLVEATLIWTDGVATLTDISTAAGVTSSIPITLVAALIKPARWEWMLEKAVELGATTIVPLQAERSIIRLPPERVPSRVARWQKICDGAVRQCGRAERVTVAPPMSIAEVLDAATNSAVWLLDETQTGAAWPPSPAGCGMHLFVGPEGGFTDAEREQLYDHGASSIGLGPALLRAETAAICALSGLLLSQEGRI
ncbi:MAG: 16S rRNA (uracil1498-N3)-methyltransferase [Bradymonadia bacterium]|jgi:16S rRNA (uracil1498-N3)-methyltransferase